MTRQDVLDALLVERYGTGSWFTSHPRNPTNEFPEAATRDDETTCARRRRQMAEDFERPREDTA